MKPEMILSQAKNGPVLNDFTFAVAQATVNRLTHGAFAGVPGNDSVDKLQSISATHIVFEQWRYVDQARCVSDGVIFVVVDNVIGARSEIPGPRAPTLAYTERGSAGMKGSSDRHFCFLNRLRVQRRYTIALTCRAKLPNMLL